MESDQHILELYTTKETEVKHKDKRRNEHMPAKMYLNNLKWRKGAVRITS